MSTVWDRVRQLKGKTLKTLRDAKPFTIVAVNADAVRLLPQSGKGSERSVPREQVEHLATLGRRREELRQAAAEEYPKSQNTSYLAAIVFEATR